jgi:hypothetical protein
MWPIFHELNDWCIIEVKPATKGDHKEDLHTAQGRASFPYKLASQTKLTKFNPTIVVEEGALVVDAEFLNMVPGSQRWCTLSSLQTKVRLQQVVHPNIILVVAEAGNNRLPNGCEKQEIWV